MRIKHLELSDGRTLEYSIEGPDDALPLVVHHATPGAPTVESFAGLSQAAAKHELRLVILGRPGYGTSTPVPGRTVGDVAADTAALLDALGADKFVTAGVSGGGPHALACGARLSGRCLSVATISGLAPFDAAGLDWLDGWAGPGIVEFKAAAEGAASLSPFLEVATGFMAHAGAEELIAAFAERLCEVDREGLRGDMGAYLVAATQRAVQGGVAGWRDDDLAFVKGWGFDVTDVSVPVMVWHGVVDQIVPIGHGRWLGANIPGAESHWLADDGHVSILRRFDSVISRLLERAAPPVARNA